MTGTDSRSAAAADLAERIAAGDRAAEAELVELYGERLRFLLRRWTRDADTAEDLYQESFRLAFEKIRNRELREPGRLAGFLRGLAKNLSLYHYRVADGRESRNLPETANEVPDPTPGLLSSLLLEEKADLARRILAELPSDRDREVLSRFYIAEDDAAEICAQLGLDRGHFKRVLFRARQRYRVLYEARALGRDGASRSPGSGGEPQEETTG